MDTIRNREALRQLDAEGLIAILPTGGAVVRDLPKVKLTFELHVLADILQQVGSRTMRKRSTAALAGQTTLPRISITHIASASLVFWNKVTSLLVITRRKAMRRNQKGRPKAPVGHYFTTAL
jgi:hypothetical protein